MSELARFIAQIGGALSAQGAGGSQGLQNFMATLAQQQAQASQQDFAREQSTRQQMFTLHRDRLQREHEEQMQNTRLGAEKAEKEEGYRGQAGALYNYAMADSSKRAAVQTHLLNTLPALRLIEDEDPINWEDKEGTLELLMDAARTGFTVGQAREVGEIRRANDDWYRTQTGGTLSFTNENDLIRHKQNRATAATKLGDIRSKAGVIGQDIQALDDDQGRGLADSFERATDIRKRIEALGIEYETLTGSEQYSPYFSSGTDLFGEATNFANNLGTLGDSLATAQSNLSVDMIGAWTPGEPTDYPGLATGYGGAVGEEDNFLRGMRSQSFQAHRTNWNGQAAYLKDVPAADQQYLEEGDRELIANLQQYTTDGGRLDLEALMADLRKATLAGDEAKATEISDMLRRVQHFDKSGKERVVARGRARSTATREVMAISDQFRHKTRLGYALFNSDEEARAALDAYGIPDDQYPDQKRAPSTEAEQIGFLQKVVGSDDGITKVAEHLFTGLQGGEDGVPVSIALDQLQLKGEQVLKMLGLEDRPEVREKLHTRLREMTGTDASAVIEAQGGAIGQLHDYNYAAVDRATQAASSHYSLLAPEEKIRYREDYVAEVFAAAPTPDEMADTLQQWINEFRGARPGFEQPSAWLLDHTRFKGDDKRLRFEREVAAEMGDAASLYDLHELWRAKDSRYADFQDEAGRIGDLAFVRKVSRFDEFGTEYETVWKDWAKGEAASYMRGDQSHRAAYEAATPEERRDQNVINQLDRLDYMRGIDISQLEGLTPQEMSMMVGIQNHLRSMPYGAAMRAVSGDQTTGGVPTGFPFEALGLTITSPETAADAAELAEPVNLRARVLDIDAERRAISRAERKLEFLSPGTTSYYDVDPREEHVDFEILTPFAIEEEKKQLGLAKDKLNAMELAQNSSMAQSIRPRIGKFLAGKDWSSPEDLAKLLTEGLPRITGEKRDLVALEESPVDPLLEDVANADTASEAIDAMIDVFAETTTIHAQRQAVSLSTMTKQEFREAVVKEAKMDYSTIRVQLNAIAREIGLRSQGGEFNSSHLPGGLQGYIDVESFNSLAKDAGDPNANAMLALHVWAAHQAALDR